MMAPMPTIHRESGFRIVIYSDDHEPAHVHVRRAEGRVKINLRGLDGQPELVVARNLTKAEIRRALAIVTDHQAVFLEKWRDIHG